MTEDVPCRRKETNEKRGRKRKSDRYNIEDSSNLTTDLSVDHDDTNVRSQGTSEDQDAEQKTLGQILSIT
jgi:hypothetical protein